MTIASLVEAEGRGGDMPKVARVIYNRLDDRAASRPTASSQIDATVNYALGRNSGSALTDRGPRRPTRRTTPTCNPGLPPGPIESPGDEAIDAAANPADGPWFFYVTVNLRTGETKFGDDLRRVPGVQGRAAGRTADVGRLLTMGRPVRCAVLGDPIEHSLSPVLHRAATPSSAWTGPTTPSGSPRRGWRRSWPAWTTTGAGCR